MSFGYILILLIMGIGWLVNFQLKRKFKKYSQIHLSNGMSGKEIAEKMLIDHGIYDVQVISTSGQLTDHYNPANKTVNLSDVVYSQRNAAAAAVAAHECGHAIQHSTSYQWLTFRSKVVPIVSFSSKTIQYILLPGILMVTVFPQLLLLGIILFAVTTLFSFITLPVEFDASNRAINWMKNQNIVNSHELSGAENSLKWAAMTYVAAAISSVATLFYYVSIFMRRR